VLSPDRVTSPVDTANTPTTTHISSDSDESESSSVLAPTTIRVLSDSDSSDSDYRVIPPVMASKVARVDQASASKPPFLTPGEVTPEVLRAWEMGCTQFFRHKDVPEEEMVGKVAWGMQDPRIQDWYLTNQDEIDALAFKAYMAEVRKIWLPTGWADTVRRKMLASSQGQRPFSEWAIDIQSQNTLLRGTTSHLTDVHILYHLESHLNADLAADYHAERIVEENLRLWIEKVRVLDEKRLRYLARQKEAVENALRNERARSVNDKKPNTNTRSYAKPGSSQAKDSSKPFTRLPALTDTERQLLRDNDGCFKCREPFAGHTSSGCSKGFPDGASYKTLTASAVLAKKSKKKEVVAAVDVDDDAETVAETVAVVMPSAVLGNGTDSGEECVAPLQTPHLRWECLVNGPAVSSPLTVSALIDHGSSLVLIGEELVKRLGLRRRKLAKSIPVSLALSQDKDSFLFTHYVKLSCTSLDNVYTSRNVRAIIAPNLCTPLLLGGPFLQHNRIVVDHELRTCIVKETNYDLLQPLRRDAPPPRRVSPSGPKLFWMKQDVVSELKTVLPELKNIVDNECEQVRGTDVLAAIQSRIDGICYQEQLKDLDAKYKSSFADRFPSDIPHNDTMPSDVLFRINLKDANKIVQQRSYDCPKKYRDAWKTLLDSHVESGRLRHSDSEWSSPSFIIPKPDPTVLPRWVNDFRKLNLNTIADNHPLPRIDEILKDCAKGKFFGKIDMTNAFFQTRVHPDDMKYLAIHTPWGKYEWTVMPMGCYGLG